MSRDFGTGPAVFYARSLREAITEPCRCTACQIGRRELAAHAATAPVVDAIMAGVDMPGRIVDDVRPDQRGE